jgi:ribosomal protein L34E
MLQNAYQGAVFFHVEKKGNTWPLCESCELKVTGVLSGLDHLNSSCEHSQMHLPVNLMLGPEI